MLSIINILVKEFHTILFSKLCIIYHNIIFISKYKFVVVLLLSTWSFGAPTDKSATEVDSLSDDATANGSWSSVEMSVSDSSQSDRR